MYQKTLEKQCFLWMLWPETYKNQLFFIIFWQISEIRCAVVQNHTKSKKNVVLSCFLFKINENRCTIVQNRWKSMQTVELSFFIENLRKSLYYRSHWYLLVGTSCYQLLLSATSCSQLTAAGLGFNSFDFLDCGRVSTNDFLKIVVQIFDFRWKDRWISRPCA